MKNLIIVAAVLCSLVQVATAQRAARSENKEMRALRQEMMQETMREAAQVKAQAAGQTAAGPSAADVGEPDSFGKNAQFLGVVGTGVVIIDPTCNPADIGQLGTDDRCILASDPALSAPLGLTFNDLGRITIPGKSVSNIVYLINNHQTNWTFENFTAANVFGRMSYSPSITIESDALNDPAAIDPNTGLPMGGSFTTTGVGTKINTQTLFPGYSATRGETYTRANGLGLSRTFFASLGLPNHVIDKLYKKQMTIHLNIRLSARSVPFGTFFYSARLLGN